MPERAKLLFCALVLFDQLLRIIILHTAHLAHQGPHLISLHDQLLWVAGVAFLLMLFSPVRTSWPIAVLAAGVLSNALSSMLPGGIVDYIPFGPFYTNSADLLVTGGAIWLVYLLLRREWLSS